MLLCHYFALPRILATKSHTETDLHRNPHFPAAICADNQFYS